MSIKGIIFLIFVVLGAILNYAAAPISKKIKVSPLRIKVIALAIVVLSVLLLFIFGK